MARGLHSRGEPADESTPRSLARDPCAERRPGMTEESADAGAPEGPREVYMPDHVCPSCFHDEDNTLDACSRACAVCGFTW